MLYLRSLHLSVCASLVPHSDKLSLVLLFIYHPSLQVKAANTHSREESSGCEFVLFTHTLRQGEGRAVNTSNRGGHLYTCECLNRSALDTGGAQRTIQLCKHAATSFPPLLRACTETRHCLNSTHSIPVPGPWPAAASSLRAWLPEQRQALQQHGSSTTDKELL